MDEVLIKNAVELLKQVGFPIFVACWFMFRTDRRIDNLTKAIYAALPELAPKKKEDD